LAKGRIAFLSPLEAANAFVRGDWRAMCNALMPIGMLRWADTSRKSVPFRGDPDPI